MLISYFKTAIRAILKNKFFSGLNIFGLAIGLAGALLITLFVLDELSFDRFHKKADRIYRMNLSGHWAGQEVSGSGSPPPLAKVMVSEFPEVEAATRIFTPGDQVVRHGDAVFTEAQLLGVDPNFFEVFTFPLLAGNGETALAEPHTVVLTERACRKYFGKAAALGENILIGDERTPFRVTAVAADPPQNSHFDFDMLASMTSFPLVKQFDWSWIWLQVVTYVVLDEHAAPADVAAKMPAVVKKHGGSVIERFSGMSYEEFERNGWRWLFLPQALTDIRLHSADVGNRLGDIGDINTVRLLSAIALLLLVIACINFTNLSTARSARRAKEIGVRKVVGSKKSHLTLQFLMESVILSSIATLLAFGLLELSRGPFELLTGKTLRLQLLGSNWMVLTLGLPLLLGILAGAYPAFYLTAFQPVAALKGELQEGMRGRRLRGVLVCLQFVISIGLVICTLLVNKQLQFMRSKDLGFDRENLVVISNTERLGQQEKAFKQALLAHPEIASASFASGLPTTGSFGDFYEPRESEVNNFLLSSVKGDYDFLQTLGFELVAGRNFSESFATDTHGVLLNETAVRNLGWREPIGKVLVYPGHAHQELTVIGVVRDFNFFSLYQNIQPFAIFLFNSDTYTLDTNYLVVKARSGDLGQTLKKIASEWHTIAPDAPFDYDFLDDRLASQFESEQQLRTVFALFTGLAILVACLGLLGLSAFAAEQRTREIGVRKVLGASVLSLVVLLSKEFAWLVLLANIVACPAAYFIMQRWLSNFAYRAAPDVWTFMLAAGVALAFALATTSWQALKAAIADPVRALKFE